MLGWIFIIAVIGLIVYYIQSKPLGPKSFSSGGAKREHAVVIGAGIGGLLAARVLSELFEKVTILERDSLNEEETIFKPRRGTPHGKQLHSLLFGGALRLSRYFIGISEEFKKDGAPLVDFGGQSKFCFEDTHLDCASKGDPEVTQYMASRPFLETHIRKRLAAIPNVSIQQGVVTSLLHENGKVTGVSVRRKKGNSENPEEEIDGESGTVNIEADFVVNCTGMKTQVENWLEQLGYGQVPKEQIDAHCIYATAIVRSPKDHLEKHFWLLYGISNSRGGLDSEGKKRPQIGLSVIPIENGMHFLAFTSYKEPIPTDMNELKEWTKQLVHPEIALEILENWEVLSPPTLYVNAPSTWRHFEQMTNYPDNFVNLGDAVSSFNPTFGQGMTHAIFQATAMGECIHNWLKDYPTGDFGGLSKHIQIELAKITRPMWYAAGSQDLARDTTDGTPTVAMRILGAVNNLLFNLAVGGGGSPRENGNTMVQLLKVQQLIRPPSILLRPEILKVFAKSAYVLLKQKYNRRVNKKLQ